METANSQISPILMPSADWKNIPLGVAKDSTEVFWDTAQSSSVLLTSSSEMGRERSIIQRNIILHLLQHLDKWQVVGLDPKKTELTPYNHFGDSRVQIASGIEDGFNTLRETHRKMMERYYAMEENEVHNFKDLEGDTRAIMFIVDNANLFLSEIENDDQKNEVAGLLGHIARLGRAAGVHLLLSTNNSALILENRGIMKSVGYRISAGRKTSLIQKHKTDTLFQKYHAPEGWFEDFLLDHYLAHKQ